MIGARLAGVLEQSFERAGSGPVGLAVSGGGDSVALLLLAMEWAEKSGRDVHVATVDHGLREGSASETEFVAQLCASLGASHTTLRWKDWTGEGNLQNAARSARKHLISEWALGKGIRCVATGHTKDDQAETFLLRLARGSGVDGLSAMAEHVRQGELNWLRPLLACSRAQLRSYLQSKGQIWIDDPSNDDPKFDRVKMRQAAGYLAELGLSADTLSETASRMQSARIALEAATLQAAEILAQPLESGSVRLQHAALFGLPEEIRLRLMAHCLKWVSGSVYRPRLSSLNHLMVNVAESRGHTLSGCRIGSVGSDGIEVCREASAVSVQTAQTGVYDGRWYISGQFGQKGLEVRPLGENGLQQRPDWRQSAESRNTLLSIPSIWYNNELKSVPLLDKDSAWTCKLNKGVDSFFSSVMTH